MSATATETNASVIELCPPTPLSPASTDLEIELLGQVLFDPQALQRISAEVGDLPASAFTIRHHKLIWVAIQEVAKDGGIPDVISVLQKLHQLGTLPEVTRDRVFKLIEKPPVHSYTVVQNAKRIKENYDRYVASLEFERIAKTATEDGIEPAAKKALAFLEKLATPPESSPDLRVRIRTALSDCYSYSDYKLAITELAKNTGLHPRQLEQLAEAIETSSEWEDERSDRMVDLAYLTGLGHKHLELSSVLHPTLAAPLERLAGWMGVDPEALLTVLIPTAASLLHPEMRIVVKESIDFIEPFVFYTGVSSESGNRKSPLMKIILKPLWKLQQEEDSRYQQALEDWKLEYAAWQQNKSKDKGEAPPQPAPPREYFLQNVTSEALDRIKAQQPDCGRLLSMDELSALFGSYGAYKGGRGADREGILSGWNGNFVKVNRAGGTRISLAFDATSITGAIQPDKLRQLMGDLNDSQGEWGRFLWYNFPLRPHKLPESDTKFEVFDLLLGLYRWLDELPPMRFKFTSEAQKIFQSYHWELEQRRCKEPRQGVRAALAKMQGYAARLSGLFYIIWCKFAQTMPETLIPKEWAEVGVLLTEFYIGQQALVYSEGEASQGSLTPILAKILDKAEQLGQLSTRLAKQSIKALREFNSPKILDLFNDLVAMGLGIVKGKIFIPNGGDGGDGGDGTTPPVTPPITPPTNVDHVDPMLPEMLTTEQQPENIEITSLQTFSKENVDHVDHVDHFSEPTSQEVVDQDTTPPVVENESLNDGQQSQQVNILDETLTQSEVECVDPESTIGSTSFPSGTGFGEKEADQEQAITSNPDVAIGNDTGNEKVQEPGDLAAQLLTCDSWQAVLDKIDALAVKIGKSRAAVFNKLKKHISGILRDHLLQLLAEHIRWFKNDAGAWSWLSGCARKFKEQAFELAQSMGG